MRESQQTVLALLRAGTAYHNSTLTIDWGDRQGLLHLRDGTIVAAEAEPLSGNGAALEIVRWQGFSLSEIDAEPVIKKNVTLSLEEIENLFERYSIGGSPVTSFDDLATLDRAVLLIHQFRYSEAGKLLAELLKHNRFNYLGWLWYSRLLKNLESIKKALSEAQKWGDHDPTVWLEVKKTGLGLANSDGGEIKRCFYCWTPLNVNESRCCYCRAMQSIGKKSPATDLKKSELINGINRYISAFKEERENGKIGYALALGFFNLGQYQKSYKYLKYINSLAPGKALFRKSLEMLLPFLPTVQQPSIPPVSRPVPAPSPASSPAVQRTVVRGEGPVILVVEDSPTARKVIKVVLKREGFGVVEAGSGEEAIAVVETINPSLILLDVMLPDTTGFDLLPRLRDFTHLSEIPVIMLTGRKGSMDKIKGLMAGSTEYLTKPFDPQKLTNAIRKYI
jgi:twitching motility two-component system response regulator PilG